MMACSKMKSDDYEPEKNSDEFPQLTVQVHDYLRGVPIFDRPKIIGFFSLDSSHKLLIDHSRLKFVSTCEYGKVNFDLNRDLDKALTVDKSRDDRIEHLLKYLLEQHNRLDHILDDAVSSVQRARFIGHSGHFGSIAKTPYEHNEGWRIVATLHYGNIYLYELHTKEKRRAIQNTSEWERRCTSWGHKFEQFILTDAPTSSPDLSVPNDENDHFYLVLTTQLNSHKLLYRAEMDGILCEPGITPPPDGGHEEVIEYLRDKKFIELKTQKKLTENYQHNNFRKFKAMKWWCQSYLTGVETVLVGFRDDEGIVNELKVFNVADLRTSGKNFWQSEVCINFLDTFLTHVKRCLAMEVERKHGKAVLEDIVRAPPTSLRFEWSPRQNVRVAKYDPHDDVIVPDWFVKSYASIQRDKSERTPRQREHKAEKRRERRSGFYQAR